MKCCEVQTASMESSISCLRVANWREKSSIGTGCGVRVGTSVMVYRVDTAMWRLLSFILGCNASKGVLLSSNDYVGAS